MHQALYIIKEEHRALAAVVHGLTFLTAEIERGAAEPDFPLLQAILSYIRGFPDRLHHPKEDLYLFKALQRRTNDADGILAELQADHAAGPLAVDRLEETLAAYQKQGALAFAPFAQEARAYCDSTFRHMGVEEGKILPLAMQVLTEEDWTTIDAAFLANNDPMIGIETQKEFRDLFRKILNLAPAPIGLADAH